MPAKHKNKRQDWYECSCCNHVISERDVDNHTGLCGVKKHATSLDYQHGYIFDGVLNGVVSLLSVDKDSSVPNSMKDRIICIHPSAMQLCGLRIGKPCVVDERLVVTAWPSSSGPVAWLSVPDKIMRELNSKKGDIVSVMPLSCDCIDAGEIYLCSSEWKEFYGQTEFSQHVKLKLDGQYAAEGNKIEVHYFGQLCQFTVEKISSETSNTKMVEIKKRDTCTGDLSESMASLEISDVSLDSESLLNQSTSSIQSDFDRDNSPAASTPNRKQRPDSSQFHTPSARKSHTVKTHKTTFYKICQQTKIVIKSSQKDEDKRKTIEKRKLCFKDIGGLDKQMCLIKEMLELPLKNPDLFNAYGLSLPHGILIYGPSGTGKTLLSRALVNEINIHTIHVTGPQVWSKFFGETEANLRNIFQRAREKSPSLIIIDEIDALCPKRENSQSELEKRVVATLLTLMDGINLSDEKEYVVVVGVTSKPDVIDSSLRRPGRFDREIEIGVPTATDRLDIIKKLLKNLPHSLTEKDITDIANTAHGFVGADLTAVFREAGLITVRRQTSCNHSNSDVIHLSREDVNKALLLVKPSAMREVQLEVPQVLWTDVGGQDDLKLKLKQAIEWPLQHPEAFLRLGVQPPRGLLMYGPPGCSKTLIAKALATESGLNFIAVKGPELFSKWVGESERAVREVFRKARMAAPSIIFFDEIDALAVERGSSSGGSNVADRVLAQLLTEIDGVEKLQDVTIVAATNRPDMIDKALLRPGRIDRIMYVPLPTPETRTAIFNLKFKTMPIASDVQIQDLVNRTDFYSGAEVTAVCHEAALAALQEDINGKCIQQRHFNQALLAITPRTSQTAISFYENYHKQSGLHSV
ncbi:ribosome biogenesis protein SPATA5 isoform X1 [Patella vulgata]|uniref:ribosome biogenesis protein SPATA5 isoform X1 n=1 Tax=Patella vulgata TaxID=6465 RepID=UPI0024A97AB6|nr:ribosome biogenesis protein SPATA5 isoform X1 [Patella vulgata]